MRGAPTALEVAVFAWLIAPILLSYFLSRTGRYEGAHVLSSLALTGLVMMVAVTTGGIVLCRDLAGRRAAGGRAVGVAPRGRVRLRAGAVVRRAADRARTFRPAAGAGGRIRLLRGVFMAFGVASATLYATGLALRRRIAGAHQLLAALCRGRPLSPAGAQHERRDLPPWPQRRGAVRFAGGGDHAGRAGRAAARPRPVRPRPCRRSSGLSHGAVGCGARRRGAQRRIPRAARCAARRRAGHRAVDFIWVEMRCRPLEQASQTRHGRSRGRRGDARRHRPQDPGTGAGTGARRRRAGRCGQDPLPRHHEPRIAHAAQRHHRLLRNDHAGRRC